ncbi:hypothetical protein [Streptococcus porci]|uniref:hypothetical protein n=1 Tax=Streptococcus porci TaxID=502567 RepID=UPI000419C989|nr:hypothetical protein [Streptococcus porci]
MKSATLLEGGNFILRQTETFAQRVPFQPAEKGNEVLISLHVGSREKVDQLIERVEVNGDRITGRPTVA